MTSTTEINLIVAQGNAVSEVQNIRKQVLDLNQQAIAQKGEDKKREVHGKVQESHPGDQIEIRADEERREGREQDRKNEERKPSDSDPGTPAPVSGNLIDIKV